MDRPELSVVIPFVDEREALALLRRALDGAPGLPESRELVFVDDGSNDGGGELVEGWARSDPRVRLVSLTRNFGHQAAVTAGLDFARGERVAVMDADLQDDPGLLASMHALARDEGWDVVYAVRARRRGSWAERLAFEAFYRLYRYAAETPVDSYSGDFCVLSRRAVDTLRRLPEKNRFVRGLRSWTGLRSKAVAADRPERAAGASRYTWAKRFDFALNGLTSFSAKPLRLSTLCGLALCAASAALTLYHFVFGRAEAAGFTAVVILILLLSGAQFLMMGIIGEYIAQIFWEVKGRPTYLVARTVNAARPGEAARS